MLTCRCGNYISLLEVMGAEDLAMRNLMEGVELLIFTSKVLCLDCQSKILLLHSYSIQLQINSGCTKSFHVHDKSFRS